MHRLGMVVGLLLLVASSASSAFAQDTSRFQLGAGYEYVRVYAEPGKAVNCSGGSAQMAWFFSRDVALVGDLGDCNVGNLSPYIKDIPSGLNVGGNLLTYQFGPKFAWRSHSRLEPFGQVLFGGTSATIYCGNCIAVEEDDFYGIKHAIISLTLNSVVMTAGGGLDVRLSDLIAIRPVQVSYLLTYGNNTVQSSFQINAGIVFRLGSR